MSISPRRLPTLAAGALLLCALMPPSAVHAGASKDGAHVRLVLKSGLVLEGMVRREGNYEIVDGGADIIFIPTGFFFLDDGARRQYFSSTLALQKPEEIAAPTDEKVLAKFHDIRIFGPQKVPTVDEVLDVGPFDANWNRTIKVRSGFQEMPVKQRLVELTPYFAHLEATEHWLWPSCYLTRELGPDVVRQLLSSHPDFEENPNLAPDVQTARRFRYVDFMAQAGFYDEAETELTRLMNDRPADAVLTKIDGVRGVLRQWRARDALETIKRMHNAGQFDAVRKRLAAFPDKDADPQTAIGVNDLRDKYQAADKAMADATRLLDALSKQLGGDARDAALAQATAALRSELQPEILPRLDAFLGQAKQAERQSADGKAPSIGPAQLLALAVTGWLGALPDPTPNRAVQLWRGRVFVLKYLAASAGARKPLLDDYTSRRDEAATLDDLTRLIPLLPPAEPAENIGTDPVAMTAGTTGSAVKYIVQLPPEYRPSRNYPVLMVLHESGEAAADQLKRWSDEAALNGYILVAPEWSQGLNGAYGYSAREHAVVLETLRDLRRRFAVDSDRVFLFGWGQGGAMAFDVGLSHPDLFAGVLPMSAGPAMFSARYYRNGQYLPFYIVNGDRSGDVNKHLRSQFEVWVSQYPMMWMQYKGRGTEFYGAEVPSMFDWMHGQKREFPLQDLGGPSLDGKYYTTFRTTDDRFYWLTTNGVQDRYLNSENNWNANLAPAMLKAHIDVENNTVFVDTTGLTQITVWLGANGDGVDMVRFDKPLTVRWTRNGAVETVWNNLPVTRSLATLMDDLARRGDRQRLFTVKLEFSK